MTDALGAWLERWAREAPERSFLVETNRIGRTAPYFRRGPHGRPATC